MTAELEQFLNHPLDDLDDAIVRMSSPHRLAILEMCVKGRDRWAESTPSVGHFWAILCDRIIDNGLRLDIAEDRLEELLIEAIFDVGLDGENRHE